jgi:ADP-dependent NAD(P)H-hydrate dehydratase / NAD(P)H-hydrate epimerase
MFSSSKHIAGARGFVAARDRQIWPLHDIASTRRIEDQAKALLLPHTLMERAGLALAKLALAVAPHARTFWIACGPGNNGGDGWVAARYLSDWGKKVIVTMLPPSARYPDDARTAMLAATQAGLVAQISPPEQFDCCIDALFGIGSLRDDMPPEYLQWMQVMHQSTVPLIAVDVPTGLHADTGCTNAAHVRATHTLNLLTLKPGTLTAEGRHVCGEIWFDDLGCNTTEPAHLVLNPPPPSRQRPHNTHKGSSGDVAIVGGALTMTGAAVLCAQAALRSVAGRVYLSLLGSANGFRMPSDIMVRDVESQQWAGKTVVAGCGGSNAIRNHLPGIIAAADRLVLDADALNALAQSQALQSAVQQRARSTTVMTPHPLEAARLLETTTIQVQSDRVHSARSLAHKFQATVVLKGSGSIIATPNHPTAINVTGNGRLATGGTGDVLAGMIGALLASGLTPHDAASQCVFRQGELADLWTGDAALTAERLANAL